MGANLVPVVRRFTIDTRTFNANDCAVVENCATVGTRKLLRFDFLCWNAGDQDVHLGDPTQNPQWFVWSPCHRHYHLKNFNEYRIFDCSGNQRTGNKQAFCLEDVEKLSAGPNTSHYTCNDQGVSAGWADVYNAGLDCQWIDITDLPDGDYVLEARTNDSGIVQEDSYGDNVTWAGLQISGNTVTEIAVPCYPEDCLDFNPQTVQATNINGRWKVVDGNHWILDFGSKEADAEKARDVIKHYSMNSICFVGRPDRTGEQLMVYFLVNSQTPSGSFAGEDAIAFNPVNVAAQEVSGRWKVTDGPTWMLDFGVSEANARKAVWIIKKYGFQFQCFVGRPHAPMMYFRQ